MHLKALAAILTIAVFSAGFGTVGHAKALSPTTNNTVQVVPGDTLSGIAARNGTTYVRLFDVNQQIKNPNLIYPGEVIQIPAADTQLANRLTATSATPTTAEPAPADVEQPAIVPMVSAPARSTVVSSQPAVSSSGVWDELAQCESGGNWSINTGNGFYGGLQFTLSSWQTVGGTGYPNQASKSEQISRAQVLQARQGWAAWPACSAKLGLR